VEGTRGGARRYEVLVRRWRRPGLLSELEARCAAIGVRCEPTPRDGSRKGAALTLTVPADVSRYAFDELSRWIYLHLDTRPYDHVAAGAAEAEAQARALEEVAAARRVWTSRELEFTVGRLARNEFLRGVESICTTTGVRWKWEARRSLVAQRIVVTVSGPKAVVDPTAERVGSWAQKFSVETGG
jgi:hypothetical protein